MRANRIPQRAILVLFIAASASGLPAWCEAQWVPYPGSGTISLGYQYTRVTDHLFSQDVAGVVLDPAAGYTGGPGNHGYLGDLFAQTVDLSADYGVWRGLAVSAGTAYVSSMYSGKSPDGPQDDGQYHGSFQDATFDVRYMIPWREFAITPSVGARFPIRNYQTLGHVAVGKHLREFPVGIAVGRSLGPFLPRAFLGASFVYSFVQNHMEHTLDQRHYELNGGYIVSDLLSVGGALQYVNTVDGIDWLAISTEDEFHDHDQAAKAEYVHAGAYASLSLARRFSVKVSYVGTLSGENTHAGQFLTIAPTWAFHAPLIH